MAGTKVVIVTGANRGIGNAICRRVLQDHSSMGLTLYACSRSGEDLKLEPRDEKMGIEYPTLDISSQDSIAALATLIKTKNMHVDVLVNNAGINTYPDHDDESVRQMLDINYLGTLHMCQSFAPILKPSSGRIVNLSSVASKLCIYSPKVAQRFRNAKSIEQTDSIARDYVEAVRKGKEAECGFGQPQQGYCVSKALVNAITRIFARDHPTLTINCCCPGWVDSAMGQQTGKPSKTVADGATIPIRLAFDDIGRISGAYWANSSVSSTARGQVMEL